MRFETKVAIAIGVGAVFVSAVKALSNALTHSIVKEAIDRDEPKVVRKVMDKYASLGKDFDEAYERASREAEVLEAIPHERIETESSDGTKLVGHFFPCEGAKRIIIAFHGWRSKWSRDFSGASKFWFANQCSVLFAEQRGQGESGGDYMGFGMTERYDVQAWAQYIDRINVERLPIYLAGISLGAATVLMATGLELPESVHGVTADCGFTSPRAIWKHVCENSMHVPYGVRQDLVDKLVRQKIDYASDSYSTLEALRTNKIPVLFIHGAADTFVPVEMTYENYMACKAPKRLLIVPGAEHGLSYVVEKEKYQNEVKAFWADFDGHDTKEGEA